MDRAIDATALRKELQALIQRAETLATNLTTEEMFRRPSADKWSAAECLAHLNITVEQYLPNIKAAVEELQSGRTRKNRQTWTARKLIGLAGPDNAKAVKTLKRFTPHVSASDDVTQRFRTVHNQLIAELDRAAKADLDGVRLASPATRLIKMSLGQCFELMAGHGKRHLGQAERAAHQPASCGT